MSNSDTPHTVPLEWMSAEDWLIEELGVTGPFGLTTHMVNAARIPQLIESYIARHSPHWVKVEDRLPEFEEPVWVWVQYDEGNGYMTVGARVDGEDGWLWGVAQHGGCNIVDIDCIEADDAYDVRKWQPLPAPPSEGETRK